MSRNGRLTVGTIVVVVVAIVAGLLISNNRKNANSTANQAANTQTVTTVTYNGKSFTPADISISSGTTITFVNNSTTPMQVSSDNAGFNAGKSLGKGESYSFKFNTKGSYTYSNHLNTAQSGKVTVL